MRDVNADPIAGGAALLLALVLLASIWNADAAQPAPVPDPSQAARHAGTCIGPSQAPS